MDVASSRGVARSYEAVMPMQPRPITPTSGPLLPSVVIRTLPVLSLERRRRAVLIVGDMRRPRRIVALVVDLDQREMGHEPRGRRTVPVVLGRLEEHAITGADHLDL